MRIFLLSAVLFIFLLSGCGEAKSDIVATTAPLREFTEAVCEGTGLNVGVIVSQPISCVHDYALSTNQMRAIESAQVLVCTDLSLETYLEGPLHYYKGELLTTIEGISLLPGEEGEFDPHIWLSPENAATMTGNIAAQLSHLYPEHAGQFQANAKAYSLKLYSLEAECRDLLSDISVNQLITFHDGFAYFAACFDLEILAAMEEESGSEASAEDLITIVSLVRENHLPAVFVEQDGSRSASSVISAETGCSVGVLSTGIGGTDYFKTIRGNAAAIREALK